MKSITTATPAFVSGAQESARLQIEANGKAFKELISGIYSDKTYAIARELIANAWDAHVLAGNNERPFDLRLPTVFDPTFAIRDYGTSMDHNTVMTLYRTLFRSTKDDPNSEDSNKFVGKFGLGSKSPFAYTDAFQLTTYLDGIQRVYDIYFNAGAPMISLFLETETEEENGVLITFPVEQNDVDDFARAATRAMEPLEVQPNLIGRKVSVPERTVLFSGEGWKLLDGTFSDAAEALQGTVLYPLRYASIPNCPSELKPLIEAPLRIEFEIGQLDVTTSRENLSYDEQTSQNIITRLTQIVGEVRTKVEAELIQHKTYFAWSKAYFALKSKFPARVWAIIENNPPKFKNRYAPTTRVRVKTTPAKIITTTTQDDGTVNISMNYKPRFKGLDICVLSNSGTYTRYIHDNFLGHKAAIGRVEIDTSKQVVLVTHNKDKRLTYAHERMKVVVQKYGRDLTYLWVKKPEQAEFAMKRLFAYLGRPEFVHTVDLADIPVPEIVKVENTRDLYKVYRCGAWVSPKNELPSTGTIYYLTTRRGELEDKCLNRMSASTIVNIFEAMQRAGVIDKDDYLIGIPVSAKNAFFNVYEAEELSPKLIDYLASFYSRETAALEDIHVDAITKYNPRIGKQKTLSCPPWIMKDFDDIITEVVRAEKYRTQKRPRNWTATKDDYPIFEKVIEGSCIEDAYLFWLMYKEATNKSPVGTDTLLSIIYDNNKEAVAAEKKEIAKRRSQLQHQMNVLGGRVLKEYPVLNLLNTYNIPDWTLKFTLRTLKEQIAA